MSIIRKGKNKENLSEYIRGAVKEKNNKVLEGK